MSNCFKNKQEINGELIFGHESLLLQGTDLASTDQELPLQQDSGVCTWEIY